MSKYYVTNLLANKKDILEEIFSGKSYEFFDQTSKTDFNTVISSNFDLIIMNLLEKYPNKSDTLNKLKAINFEGIVILISPANQNDVVKVNDNIYLFKNLRILKEETAQKYIFQNEVRKFEQQKKESLQYLQSENPHTLSKKEIDKVHSKKEEFINKEQTSCQNREQESTLSHESIINQNMNMNEKHNHNIVNKLTNIAIENSYVFIDDEDKNNSESNIYNPVDISNYPPSIDIKKICSRYNLTNHLLDSLNKKRKKIVLWKPYENRASLHILINFAIFLAESGIDIAVVEALTREGILLEQLLHYTDIPSNWHHFMESVFSSKKLDDSDNIQWRWKNVDWYPITTSINNNGIEWYPKDLDLYMSISENYDLTFIYIPQTTGIPIHPSDIEVLYTMKHADEVWIFADSFFKTSNSKKEYIHELQNSYNIDRIFLIYTNCFDKKMANIMAKSLELPLMASFPVIDHKIHLNNSKGSRLLMEYEHIYSILANEFYKMRDYYPEYQWIWEKIGNNHSIISPKNKKINNNSNLTKKFFKLRSLF